MSALLAAAALAIAAGPECRLPPLRPGALPFRAGETLSYDIDIMGVVKAGSISLEVQPAAFLGTQIPLRARIRNTSVFAKVRRISGMAFSWVDLRTLLPERYRDEILEDGVRKTSDARIAADAGAVTIENQYGEAKKAARFERAGTVLDVLAGAYYLRAARLERGQEMCFDLVAMRRYWRVTARVAATERVETPAGIFDTVRVDAEGVRADRPEVKRPIHLWISTDPRRLMVAAVGEIDLGPVRATLVSVGR